METQVIEGTFTDVQRQLGRLPLEPETRLRLEVTEAETTAQPPSFTLNPDERRAEYDAEIAMLANAPRRNGIIQVPTKSPGIQVTVEMVNALKDD